MSVPVVVIGAGVVGLTTALRLKQQMPELDVVVVAAFLPGDYDASYASPYAGANWQSFASSTDLRQQEIDAEAYGEFAALASDPRAGIWRRKNALYYTQMGLDRERRRAGPVAPWFEHFSNGRQLAPHELLPGTVYGREFDGFVVSVPTYLPFLVQRCLELGVGVRRVPHITDIRAARHLHGSGRPARFVVNCAGLGAASIAGVQDPSENYPVRGQVLVVRNAVSKVHIVCGFDHPHEELYVFPRKEGGAIIGGCFYRDARIAASEDTALTARIAARALEYLPELVDPRVHGNPDHLDVVSVNVGLRPFREHGPRIERDAAKPWLIHGYGAGGGGYQGSYGFAKQIVAIVREALVSLKL